MNKTSALLALAAQLRDSGEQLLRAAEELEALAHGDPAAQELRDPAAQELRGLQPGSADPEDPRTWGPEEPLQAQQQPSPQYLLRAERMLRNLAPGSYPDPHEVALCLYLLETRYYKTPATELHLHRYVTHRRRHGFADSVAYAAER